MSVLTDYSPECVHSYLLFRTHPACRAFSGCMFMFAGIKGNIRKPHTVQQSEFMFTEGRETECIEEFSLDVLKQ